MSNFYSTMSKAEQRAKEAENYPAIFGSINLTDIREKVGEILKMIGRDGIFREYTLHDSNHINALLALVDKLIPEETIEKMRIADWLMIVLSCYFHDLGMLVTKKEFEGRESSSEFHNFKEKIMSGEKGRDYEEAVNNIEDLTERDEFIYQEFVRENHAKRIFNWIQGRNSLDYGDAKDAVDAINGLLSGVDKIFRADLAKVCLSHHEDDLYDLDKYKINRVYGEDPEGEANLHYAAIILRVADVLQIQKKRVPTVLYKLIDPSNPKSQEEWSKQEGVRAVKMKSSVEGEQSDTIEIHAAFDKESAYFGLLAYIQQYASKEIERSYEWVRQANKKGAVFHFPWRYIDWSQVEPNGFEGRSYGFKLDQEKILSLLTGHTLYDDQRVAVREVLQNALDAVRFRSYLNPGEGIGKIEVGWNSRERRLVIRDTGTGMTQDTIEKFLLNVGSSYYQSDSVAKEHSGFSSISRFGIGVLSTFMIADEVEITTIHPDDDFARRLTLPSVVKSYLIRKIEKSDETISYMGGHGTEVVLKVRRSADLGDVDDIVRYWMIMPKCEVICKIDDAPAQWIGFSSPEEVLKHYYSDEIEGSTPVSNFEIKSHIEDGLEMSYGVRRSRLTDIVDFAPSNGEDDYDEEYFLHNPPGMCIEGIRVRSEPAGYNTFSRSPCVFANLIGPNAPKTNVARSDIEQNIELENSLFKIYSALGEHVQGEFNRLTSAGAGIAEAAIDANSILKAGLRDRYHTSPSAFNRAMDKLKIIALEENGECKAANQEEIDKKESVWTVDSRLVQDIESICGSLGINLPAEKVVKDLGEEMKPALPYPRVLGSNEEPVSRRGIHKINIYPEERSHRIDIEWKEEALKNWIDLKQNANRILNSSRVYVEGIWIEKDLGPIDCPDYDLIIWRNKYYFLNSSKIFLLYSLLGGEDYVAQWLGPLIEYGYIPTSQIPVLRDQLFAAKVEVGEIDRLITRLVLPHERRFGGRLKSERFNIR